jgi:hypothetical protein
MGFTASIFGGRTVRVTAPTPPFHSFTGQARWWESVLEIIHVARNGFGLATMGQACWRILFNCWGWNRNLPCLRTALLRFCCSLGNPRWPISMPSPIEVLNEWCNLLLRYNISSYDPCTVQMYYSREKMGCTKKNSFNNTWSSFFYIGEPRTGEWSGHHQGLPGNHRPTSPKKADGQ